MRLGNAGEVGPPVEKQPITPMVAHLKSMIEVSPTASCATQRRVRVWSSRTDARVHYGRSFAIGRSPWLST